MEHESEHHAHPFVVMVITVHLWILLHPAVLYYYGFIHVDTQMQIHTHTCKCSSRTDKKHIVATILRKDCNFIWKHFVLLWHDGWKAE
jgi:hypothetical protein